ncbi:MAG: OmpH family outer membrane protein [Cytophagales bacterium]|nr:OmpH family outer membrane protein [Cytophagales bacterium]
MKKIIITSLFAIAATYIMAQVKPFRLGYTNVDYLISLHPDSKKVDAELKTYRTQLDKEAENLAGEFRGKYESYEKGKTMMAEPVRATKEKELMELQERIQEFQRNAEADLQKKQMELLQPVLDKIQKAIDAIADENGFTYVLNSDAGYGTTPVLLHGPPSDNVTDLILKKLGITPPPKDATGNAPGSKSMMPSKKPGGNLGK